MRFVEAPNNFYLGAQVDPKGGEVIPDSPLYYEARHLTTHAVILGMTGSGKTGLGITMLEEAMLDNIPIIVIDPKGDITNMLLAFPEMRPEDFSNWINPEDAAHAKHSLDEHAVEVTKRWRQGLIDWGVSPQRVKRYKDGSNITIYTPGSESGIPVSILQSFEAPTDNWLQNEERLREHIIGIVTALLELVGIHAEPVKDREHLFLSNIFEYNWRQGRDLTLNELILQIQRPPFDKLGVFDVETVFPEKDRFKLAQQLNNILAAPSFQVWMQGEPLHIPSLLYTQDGLPRTTIFYLAHLSDVERQFIVTLLTQSLIAWMRSQSGATSLRAIMYIDEAFGMFPPHPHNPPTKEPIMRLLKQARAFGIGMLLSTQNPVDIDYKGLSNIGTWFIGKMQTDNDRQRVLEGLNNAQDATSALDIKQVEDLLGNLNQRQFIYHNIHEENTPLVMQARWTMSYLRGPLSRPEIDRLMAPQKASRVPTPPPRPQYLTPQSHTNIQSYDAARGELSLFEPATEEPLPAEPEQPGLVLVPSGFSSFQPEMPNSIQQFFIPVQNTVEQAVRDWEHHTLQSASSIETSKRLIYRPSLLAQLQVRYIHSKTNMHELLWYAFVLPTLPSIPFVDWSQFQTEPFDPRALDVKPFARASYGEIPPTLRTASGFKDLQNSLREWMHIHAAMNLYYNPTLKLHSNLGEDRRTFLARVASAAREAREAEIEEVAEKYHKELEKMEDKARKQTLVLEAKRDELEARKREELLTGAENVWRLMKGYAYRTISRAGELRREVGQNEDRVTIMQEELLNLADKLDATEEEMANALHNVQEKWARLAREVEEIPLRPYKKDISFILFGIGWVPYWDVKINGALSILPASNAGLSQAQGSLPAGLPSDSSAA